MIQPRHPHRPSSTRRIPLRKLCIVVMMIVFVSYIIFNVTWVYRLTQSTFTSTTISTTTSTGSTTNPKNTLRSNIYNNYYSNNVIRNSSNDVKRSDLNSNGNSNRLTNLNQINNNSNNHAYSISNSNLTNALHENSNNSINKEGTFESGVIDSNKPSMKNDADHNENYNSNGVPAYVVSLILCKDQENTVGFLDSAAVLRHSVHKNSKHYADSGSKYSYKMYAIVHQNCAKYAPLLESVGYETIVRDTPIDRKQIRNNFYRTQVEHENCCGSAEFIKMYAYKLTQHPVVVHFDLDKIIMKPFDDLFDAIIYDGTTDLGKAARRRLDVEWPEDAIPDQIDAFFTRDYTSSWPWKKIAGVQGGFIVLKPSVAAFDEYMEIILEGNYEPGFNNESGWGGLGFGGFQGAKAFQGVVAYFYDHFHPGTAVELDVCKWNQVAADVIWRGPRGPDSIGECRKYPRNDDHENNYPRNIGEANVRNNGCDDCRITPIDNVYTIHYTACKKPWSCPTAREGPRERHRIDPSLVNMDMCYKLHREWFELRKDFEQLHYSVTKNEDVLGKDTGDYKKDYYLGYCSAEGKYNPMVFPEGSFDISKLYTHANNSKEVHENISAESNTKMETLNDKMKRKLKSLRKPPWPQLDSRTVEAIANGTVLGSPSDPHQSTIVSAYYNFESKHKTTEYREWFVRLLRSSDPLIIFVEPESEWYDFVVERRSHAPTIVVQHPFDMLVMSTTFTESFWQEQHEIDLEAKIHRGTGVYKIWNEKLVFIHAVVELNPFNSTMFTWMDAGYFRSDSLAPPSNELIVRLNITNAGVPASKVFFNHVRGDSLDTSTRGRVATAGNSFMGTAEAMYELYDKYYLTFLDWIRNQIFVGSDQMVMAETCFRYAHVCHPFYPGRFKDWFSMSKIIKQDTYDLSKVSPKFFFGAEPEGFLPPHPPLIPISSHSQIRDV